VHATGLFKLNTIKSYHEDPDHPQEMQENNPISSPNH